MAKKSNTKHKSQSVLILNASYQPLSVVSADSAILKILKGKATPLDGSGTFYTSAEGEMEIPYVILMNYVVKQGKTRGPAWSRKGVLARDGNKCVYCGNHATTIDHVFPRSLGGENSYENCVAACQSCNSEKANRTLKQLGWAKPVIKSPSHLSRMLLRNTRHPEQMEVWKKYIYMYQPNLKKQLENV